MYFVIFNKSKPISAHPPKAPPSLAPIASHHPPTPQPILSRPYKPVKSALLLPTNSAATLRGKVKFKSLSFGGAGTGIAAPLAQSESFVVDQSPAVEFVPFLATPNTGSLLCPRTAVSSSVATAQSPPIRRASANSGKRD